MPLIWTKEWRCPRERLSRHMIQMLIQLFVNSAWASLNDRGNCCNYLYDHVHLLERHLPALHVSYGNKPYSYHGKSCCGWITIGIVPRPHGGDPCSRHPRLSQSHPHERPGRANRMNDHEREELGAADARMPLNRSTPARAGALRRLTHGDGELSLLCVTRASGSPAADGDPGAVWFHLLSAFVIGIAFISITKFCAPLPPSRLSVTLWPPWVESLHPLTEYAIWADQNDEAKWTQ